MKKTILLIEDRLSHANAFMSVAQKLNCAVQVVDSVQSLRDAVKERPFGGWDLIVMDCQMPEQPGGELTTRHIEEMHRLIRPLVQKDGLWIWSVLSDVEDVARFLDKHDLNKFSIAKGQTPERLEKSLRKALNLPE